MRLREGLISKSATSNEYKKDTRAGAVLINADLRHRSVGPGGEQIRKR